MHGQARSTDSLPLQYVEAINVRTHEPEAALSLLLVLRFTGGISVGQT